MQSIFRKLSEKEETFSNAAALVAGLLCGIFCAYGFYPFACAAYLGFVIVGSGEYAALFGVLLGLVLKGAYTHILPLAVCFGLNTVWHIWRGDALRVTDRVLMLAVAEMSELKFMHDSIRECVLVACMCIMGLLGMFILYNGVASFRSCVKRKRLASDEELLHISLLAGFIVLLLTPFGMDKFSISCVVCAVLCMIASGMRNTGGLYVAILASLGAGFSYNDGVYSIAVAGILCTACMVCALIGNGEKLRTAAVFGISTIVTGCILSRSVNILDIPAAVAVYMCIPQKLMRTLGVFLTKERRKKDSSLIRKIDALARVTGGMSDVFETAEMPYDGRLAIRQICAMSGLLESINDERQAKCKFSVDVGLACIPKANCAHTGDSVGRADVGGKTVVALSDGMGSGLLAHNESAATVECFLDMQRAGFNTYDSIDGVNRRLIARSENDFYATLDALVTDRLSAVVTTVKMGAPPSYLLRDGKVMEIFGESLPIGIIESVKPAVSKMQSKAGDIFILMSDGVQDALGKDVIAAIAENISTERTSKENANILLDLASSDGVQDDMSIVCIRISAAESK